MIQYQDLFDPYCQDFSWWTNSPGDDFGTAGMEANNVSGLRFGGGRGMRNGGPM
jgi:hypothetical protein